MAGKERKAGDDEPEKVVFRCGLATDMHTETRKRSAGAVVMSKQERRRTGSTRACAENRGEAAETCALQVRIHGRRGYGKDQRRTCCCTLGAERTRQGLIAGRVCAAWREKQAEALLAEERSEWRRWGSRS
jgi:hypothetical protein